MVQRRGSLSSDRNLSLVVSSENVSEYLLFTHLSLRELLENGKEVYLLGRWLSANVLNNCGRNEFLLRLTTMTRNCDLHRADTLELWGLSGRGLMVYERGSTWGGCGFWIVLTGLRQIEMAGQLELATPLAIGLLLALTRIVLRKASIWRNWAVQILRIGGKMMV